MAIVRQRTPSLAAGAVIVNLLAGSKFEFLSRPAVISLWGTDDGTGEAAVDFTLGNTVVAEDLPLNNAATAGDIRKDADFIGSGVGDAGDRIQIRIRNIHATNAVFASIMLEINEIA